MKDMGYQNTFITVAADCPTSIGLIPLPRGERKPIHLLQYELLTARPYHLTHADLLFEVHVLHKSIPPSDRTPALRARLLATPHPCLRASLLPKKYGWGVHYDASGRIALHPLESPEYQRLSTPGSVANLVSAMRSSRA